ncbi:MAG: DUF983 domain-containing protein [Bacteroidia bacterium]|nr:DUF983 domain-containing protein [Bacteroidia bacterium]
MRIADIIYSTLLNRCPRCHKGSVFKCSNPYRLKRLFEMNETCSHCGQKFEPETNFYYGAMYVSYALTSGWFIVWFVLNLIYLNWEPWKLLLVIIGGIVLLSPVTLRWSRLLWLNFFVRPEERAKLKEKANTI